MYGPGPARLNELGFRAWGLRAQSLEFAVEGLGFQAN